MGILHRHRVRASCRSHICCGHPGLTQSSGLGGLRRSLDACTITLPSTLQRLVARMHHHTAINICTTRWRQHPLRLSKRVTPPQCWWGDKLKHTPLMTDMNLFRAFGLGVLRSVPRQVGPPSGWHPVLRPASASAADASRHPDARFLTRFHPTLDWLTACTVRRAGHAGVCAHVGVRPMSGVSGAVSDVTRGVGGRRMGSRLVATESLHSNLHVCRTASGVGVVQLVPRMG